MVTVSTSSTRREYSTADLQRMEAERQRQRYILAHQDPSYYADPRTLAVAKSVVMPGEEGEYLTQSQFNRQAIAAHASTISPTAVRQMQNLLLRYPIFSPGIAASTISIADRLAIPDEVLDQIMILDGQAASMDPTRAAGRESSQGSESEKGGTLSNLLGSITRPLFALMSMPYEALIGGIRSSVDSFGRGDVLEGLTDVVSGLPVFGPTLALTETGRESLKETYGQTLGGQFLGGLADGPGGTSADMGEGFIPRGDVARRQAAAARSAAPLVHGHAWTLGRGVGSLFFDNPDDLRYKNLSGLIDMTTAVLLDPLIILGVASKTAQGIRAGSRLAQGTRLADEVAEAAIARDTINLSEQTAEALRMAERVNAETLVAANSYAAESAREFTSSAMRLVDDTVTRVADVSTRRDVVAESLAQARRDAAAAREVAKAERRLPAEARAAEDAEDLRAVETLQASLGDEGLDAISAKVISDSPDLPGPFTDALFASRQGAMRALPGSDDGIDAIIRLPKAEVRTVSVDDRVPDVEAVISALSKPKRAGLTTAAANNLREVMSTSGTYGDLLSWASRNGMGDRLLRFMRSSDVDGVTDVFRLTGGEGGVWWTTTDARAMRWSPDGYQKLDQSPEAMRQRVADLVEERKILTEELNALKKESQAKIRWAKEQAAIYDRAVKVRTQNAESAEAIRNSLETAVGVRRSLGGKPEIDHESLKSFLFGPTNHFDEALGVDEAVPTVLAAAEKANRAYMGVATLGASEVFRAGRKLIQPFAQRSRELLLDTIVKLDESPQNLGLLHRLTGGKLDPEIMTALLRSKTSDEALEVLAPAIGVDLVRPITPDVLNAARLRVSGMGAGRTNSWLFSRAATWMAEWVDRATSIAPRTGQYINLADPATGAKLLRNYLDNLPHMGTQEKDLAVGRFLAAETEVGRARQVMNAMNDVAEWFTVRNNELKVSDEVKDALNQSLKSATRTFESGRTAVNDWWQFNYATDGHVGVVTSNGDTIILPGPQLEAELARGGLVLPNMKDLRDSIGRWGAALEQVPGLRGARDLVDGAMDYWRSAVLFRLAYTVRNIGEMQFRMFLGGHRSIFNDPLGAVGMASAINKRTAFSKGLLARFAAYDKTATGRELTHIGQEDLDALENVLDEFLDLLNRQGSSFDMRTARAVEARHDLTLVRKGQAGFNAGWAEELIKLRGSRLARIVAGDLPKPVAAQVHKGVDPETAVVAWMMDPKSSARPLVREYVESENYAAIFHDASALRQFLFDSPRSIRNRIMEYTGGHEDLVRFIATGAVTRDANPTPLFTMSTRGIDPELREAAITTRGKELGRVLGEEYADVLGEDTFLQMRALKPSVRRLTKPIDRVLDGFFNWNGRKETAWAQGPEFMYAFNDSVVRLMPAMTTPARAEAFEFIKSAQGRFRFGGETMGQARAAMKAKPGTLTMADVERVASREASAHVKNLFYDARKRGMIFHQLRLVFPFAQPFFDTLWHWGRLMAERPYMVEKLGRLGTGLSEAGSGVIYDDFDWIDPFTDRESRDPTQGFIYTDPASGEQVFSFPLIGSVLGAAISPFAGFNAAEAQMLTAPVENLNLAFQGDVDYLPSVGPLLTFPLSQIMDDDWYGSAPEWFRSYLFPFGEPNLEGGVLEAAVFPSWARRLAGALYSEDFRAYSYKPMMSYFVSNKEYPGLRSDPNMQAQLVEDVQAGSRWLTFIRAVGAAVLPAAPRQEIFTADADGRLIGTAYMADRYEHLRNEAAGDYEAATHAFIDTYGLQAIGAILPTREGETTLTGPAFDFYKRHSDEMKGYTDVLGDFFPGDFSFEAMQFQENTNARRRLSVQERADVMIRYLYQAEKTQLEGRAAELGWDVEQMDLAEEDLKARYGGVIPTFVGEPPSTRIDKYRRALENLPELAETRGGQGAKLIIEAYDEYSAIAEDRFGSGLASKDAEDVREDFLDEVDSITQQFGGMDEAEGSVHTIARRFVELVTPRS